MLHDRPTHAQPFQVHYNSERYQNGTEGGREQNHLSYTVITPDTRHYDDQHSTSPAATPMRRSRSPQRQSSAPEPPPPDDMEPQNISFIGNADDDALRQGINRLNISSGTRTYRIPSPTRPSLGRNSFQQPDESADNNEKGFYISFDNEQPKRPKPPLRAKRGSPKKEKSDSQSPERSPDDAWSEMEERRYVIGHCTIESENVHDTNQFVGICFESSNIWFIYRPFEFSFNR
ncbi:unnamed protein product [Diatraea saccharalis]|uniref:Uncharacterized protein n=1 Tax=Diatraea saccharalis TaxID=40085 RepID=A0A9N9QVK3_9NEOP|nr:unnamed protein product [Diatraea saccharalis]